METTTTTTIRLNTSNLDVWDKETTCLDDILDEINETNIETELMSTKIPTNKTITVPTTTTITRNEKNRGVKIVVTSKPFPTKLTSTTTTTTKTNLENFFSTGNSLTVPTTMASTSVSSIKQLVRIAPKLITTTTASTTTTTTTTTTTMSKTNISSSTNLNSIGTTAVKTTSGKVFYIQNSQSGSLPVVRLQTKSAAAMVNAQSSLASSTTNTSAAKVSEKVISTSAPIGTSINNNNNNANTNKTITVQIVRTADGKLVPIKTSRQISTTTSTEIATSSATRTIIPTTAKIVSGQKLSLSAKDMENKKIITSNSSGQFIVKAPIKAFVSGNNTSNIKPTTTTTSLSETTTITKTNTKTTPILETTTTINNNNSNIKKPIQIVGVSKPITTSTVVLSKTKNAITTTVSSSTETSSSASKTSIPTTTTTTSAAPTTLGGNKFFVQNSGGKQIVISNQHIIKLAGKPTISTTTATNTTTTTTTPTTNTNNSTTISSASGSNISNMGKLKAVQITGKPGIQYVRVLPAATKLTNLKSTSTTTTATTTTTTTSIVPTNIKTIVVSKPLTGTTTLTTTTTTTTNTTKPASSTTSQKITIIRQPMTTTDASGSKVIFTNSTTSMPMQQNKVQKAIVPIPETSSSSRGTIVHSNSSILNKPLAKPTAISTLSSTIIAKNQMNSCKSISIDFNDDFKRFTNTLTAGLEPESKRMRLANRNLEKPNRFRSSFNDGKDLDKTFNLFPRSDKLFGSTLSTMNIETVCKDDKEKEFQRVKQQLQQQSLAKSQKTRGNKNRDEDVDIRETGSIIDASNSTVLVRRKHCNCSKSQCMKLYCDCFANGEFCQDCTCRDCKNNLENEDERQRAIKICLERNPTAFQPKITTCTEGVVAVADASMRHNKGCNCKRSSCLKNYCECYEAKIPCSSNCKCVGCRNIEDRLDLNMDPIDPSIMATIKGKTANSLKTGQKRSYAKRGDLSKSSDDNEQPISKRAATDAEDNADDVGNTLDNSDADARQAAAEKQINFITSEVVAATVQCMISQADQCNHSGLDEYLIEKMIIEEMGRCLVEIIDFSIRNTNSSFSQD